MTEDGSGHGRTRIVVLGAGFAGFHAARALSEQVAGEAEIVLINPTDYFLYLPLLPEVAAGLLDPRRVAVSLPARLPQVRLVLGSAEAVDLDARTVSYRDTEGNVAELKYDRLLVTTGSVNKLLPIPGVGQHAHGFRTIGEALYLRDHMVRQVELAAATRDADERRARLTFVVVGAGYTGTEVAAQGQLFTRWLVGQQPALTEDPTWMLLDLAPRLLPGLSKRMSATATRVLGERGVTLGTGVSVAEATADGVGLTDGRKVATRSLIWCVGVRPEPLIEGLNLPTEQGRVVVDEYLSVPGRPELYSCGDVAAVPDLTRRGQITPMTAQHAERQGRTVAVNIAASLGHGQRKAYRHRDLGFLVDLGGWQAAANPLHLPMSGPLAKAVTRGYHLISLPGNRVRTAVDWLENALMPRQGMQLGLVRAADVPLDTASPNPG